MTKIASIIDCHTHSSFSCDSKATIQNAARQTKKIGLGGITFTDHLELGPLSPERIMRFDFAERSKQLTVLQEQFKNDIKILNGIEVGFEAHIAQEAQAIIQHYGFDLVICSTHTIGRFFADEAVFYKDKTKYQAYNEYLEAIYKAISTFNDFDVVGHIGYICRYAPYQDKSLKYTDYREIIDEILKTVIKKNKGIEINTAGFAYRLGFTHPTFDVIKRYKELGGTIITLGSDAHGVDRIGDKFGFVIEQLVACGFTSVTYFEKRSPVFVKISP